MSTTVLITGASKGLGRATALFFATKGWNVIASMRSTEKETELTCHENVLIVRLDVEDAASIDSAVLEAMENVGRMDVLINNAGFGQYGLFEALTPEQISEAI